MASASVYVGTPKHPFAAISAANTNLDGTGTTVLLFTAGGSGARFESATVKAIVTTTAGMVRFYTSQDSGTTKTLIAELPIAAITKSATVAAFTGVQRFVNGLILEPSERVYVSTEKAEAMYVYFDMGGNF